MADIKFAEQIADAAHGRNAPSASGKPPQPATAAPDDICYDLIELLFFAYRDFIGDADQILAGYGYGRAHHRVLHFVSRHPGLSVAQLLDILKITKQSLARVLKPLIDDGFVVQREGRSDRRQRLLFVTDKGRALALDLARLQTRRLTRALNDAGPAHEEAAKSVLRHVIEPVEQAAVLDLIRTGIDPSRAPSAVGDGGDKEGGGDSDGDGT